MEPVAAELRDGSSVGLRPVRAADEAELLALFEGLSLRSRSFRFFSGGANLARSARMLARVEGAGGYGVVAVSASGQLVAHATYVHAGGDRAEVAFAVADELQGIGLGTLLLAHLAGVARLHGVATFFAEVMPGNLHMTEVFEDSGFEIAVSAMAESTLIEFPTGPPPPQLRRFAERARMQLPEPDGSVLNPDVS